MKIKHLSSKVDEGSELASTQLVDNTFSFLQTAMVANLLGIIYGVVFFVIGVVCHIKKNMIVTNCDFFKDFSAFFLTLAGIA